MILRNDAISPCVLKKLKANGIEAFVLDGVIRELVAFLTHFSKYGLRHGHGANFVQCTGRAWIVGPTAA